MKQMPCCLKRFPSRSLTVFATLFKVAPFIGVTILCILSTFTTALAQPAGAATPFQWYQQNTETVLNNARRLIEPTLGTAERQIAQDTTYRVTASPGIGVFAAYEDGKRIIVIHAGTIQMIDWFFDAIAIDQELHHSGCYKEFVAYVTNIISDNQQRVINGLAPRPALPPVAY